jgi:hypothetical protein
MDNIKKNWFTWAHPILLGGADPKSATSFAAMRVLQPLMGNNRYDRQSSTIPIVPGLGDIHHTSLHQEQFAWYVNKAQCSFNAKAYTIIAPIRYTTDVFFRDKNGRSTGFPLYYGIGAKVDLCKLWEIIKRQTHLTQVDLTDSKQIQDGVQSLLLDGRLDDYYLIYMASYVQPQLFDLYIRNEHYPWANESEYLYICHWDNWNTLRSELQEQGIVKKFVTEAHKKYPLKNYIAKYQTQEYTDYWDNPMFQAAMTLIPAIWLSRFKLRIWMQKIYKKEAK